MGLYRGKFYIKGIGKLQSVTILQIWLYREWLYRGATVYRTLDITNQNRQTRFFLINKSGYYYNELLLINLFITDPNYLSKFSITNCHTKHKRSRVTLCRNYCFRKIKKADYWRKLLMKSCCIVLASILPS